MSSSLWVHGVRDTTDPSAGTEVMQGDRITNGGIDGPIVFGQDRAGFEQSLGEQRKERMDTGHCVQSGVHPYVLV